MALRPWLQEFGASVLVIGGSMTGSWDLIGPALLQGLEVAGRQATALTASVAARPERAALHGRRRVLRTGPKLGPAGDVGRRPGRRPNTTRVAR